MHINDTYALQEVLNRVVRRDYDLIDERVAKALLEAVTEEVRCHQERLEMQAAADEAYGEMYMAQYD